MCVVVLVDMIFSGSESTLRLRIMFSRSNLYREYLFSSTTEYLLFSKDTEYQ
jgi:hypothetical protein